MILFHDTPSSEGQGLTEQHWKAFHTIKKHYIEEKTLLFWNNQNKFIFLFFPCLSYFLGLASCFIRSVMYEKSGHTGLPKLELNYSLTVFSK